VEHHGVVSQQTLRGAMHPHLLTPMRPRDPSEESRGATPLELFFDLVVVVAVALAAQQLHDGIIHGDELEALLNYGLVFFAIWWAWVNFTWFASAYDTDDVAFRVSTFAITTGALVLAAGVPAVFARQDFTLAVIGYIIMRVPLVTQWLRVMRDDPPRRETARRYAIGVTACQLGWTTLLIAPGMWPLTWPVGLVAELLVPIWAERAERMPFHPEHITERYGLFMIIVLGESVLASSLAIQSVIGEGLTGELAAVIVGSLLIVYSMWWIYFDRPEEHLLEMRATAFAWSYLHLPIFASGAAVGAGLVVAIEAASREASLASAAVGAAVGIPLVVFLISLWLLYLPMVDQRLPATSVLITVVLVLGALLTPSPVLVIGLILTGLVTVKVVGRVRGHAREGPPHGTSMPASADQPVAEQE
jgi:low temperature requirement protein LtrA